jgi:prolyl oligopeptidase
MMTDTPVFLDLEYDEAAIAAFVSRENARTEARLTGPGFDSDVATLRAVFEQPDRVMSVTRRGKWQFTYRLTAENPRGLWLCLPDDHAPLPEAAWETAFDLDAFCAASGQVWHWRGAATAWFDPTKVLLRLSLDGSDLTRHLEYDLTARKIVPGGFDIAPERGGSVDWIDADTLLWTCATGDDAQTRSGWPRHVRHLHRNGLSDLVFAAGANDLLATAYLVRAATGVCAVHVVMPAINMNASTLITPDGPVTLPTPADTAGATNGTHYVYVAHSDGEFPTGTLVLGRFGETPSAVFTPGPRRAVDEESVFFHENWLIWKEADELRPRLMALDLQGDGPAQELPLPEAAEVAWVHPFDANPLGGDGTLMLEISGFLVPRRSYLFDLKNGIAGITYRLLLSQPVQFDATGHQVQLLTARSDDGTMVPYHLVRPMGATGPVPVLLTGYGGYAVSVDPSYDAATGKMWLEHGGAYAMAHIRGGGEFGPTWWTVAKGPGRPRAFEDFAAIASDLVARGISTAPQIACHGGSNGGLLCGVMLTRYPERFGAVWANVGVHDMLRYHLFPSGAGWIDEYGDPDDPNAAAWLAAYSPLHNIHPTPAYPPALIDTSDSDDRVHPSHSRRFAAALRAAGHDTLFYSHAGGHGGGGGSDEKAREIALGYRFLRQAVGLDRQSG